MEKTPHKLIFNNPRSSNQPESAPDPKKANYYFIFLLLTIVFILIVKLLSDFRELWLRGPCGPYFHITIID